jgi:RNA-directed DNA polymerase
MLRLISNQILYAVLDFSKTGKSLGGGLRGFTFVKYILAMKNILSHNYEDLISIDNLLPAWQEFVKAKRSKKDVQEFSFNLMDNILSLHEDLKNYTYKHSKYECFKVSDPKPRIIHKALIRDRLLHRAVYRILYPFFDKTFISDLYSCRDNKGTHKAINRFREFAYIVSKNNAKTCWVLKCDIKRFFASVDQCILVNILKQYIKDENTVGLLKKIIFSFESNGLPLGNLTSQLFANVYLNELDRFIKHKLKARHYIRYADDFVIMSDSRDYLKNIILIIKDFLQNKLKLTLHPDKIFIKTLCSGVDFLGWVNFSDYRILRTKTKNRMLIRIKENLKLEMLSSYLGLLKHGNCCKIKESILNNFYNKEI